MSYQAHIINILEFSIDKNYTWYERILRGVVDLKSEIRGYPQVEKGRMIGSKINIAIIGFSFADPQNSSRFFSYWTYSVVQSLSTRGVEGHKKRCSFVRSFVRSQPHVRRYYMEP